MSKRAKTPKMCVYCGVLPGATRDHVIPRSLFDVVPPIMVTVPVCQPCNNRKSRNDDYFRDMLVVDVRCSRHPVAKAVQEKVLRSGQNNRSLMVRDMVEKARWQPGYTNGGIYVGHFHAVPVQQDRLEEIFTDIVRGLYYKLHQERLPDDLVVEHARLEEWEAQALAGKMRQLGAGGPYRLGNVFGCMYIPMQTLGLTEWLMWFYGGMFIRVSTAPKGYQAGVNAPPVPAGPPAA